MRSTRLHTQDGMSAGFCHSERFDDGLVHNHHWAVTADEAYPSHRPASENHRGWAFTTTPMQNHEGEIQVFDRHDDGLVHNHDWAVSGK
jgi:hypothetical protein